MPTHFLKAVQLIPASIEETWEFFSNPAKLPLITPENLSFKIISNFTPAKMYPGQIIEYYVAPIAGIRLYWMTEITHVDPYKYFVDEQRFGPYSMWHHQHFFKETENGVEMTDIVHYKNPLGFIGSALDPLITKPRLKKIFDHRRQKITEIFGDQTTSRFT